MTEIHGDIGIIVYPSKDSEVEFKKATEIMVKKAKDKYKIIANTKSGFPRATISITVDKEGAKAILKMLDSCLNYR